MRRYRGITIVLVVLAVAMIATTCLAGELTGASTYGVRWDSGEWIASSGTTLDYEVARGLFITLDMRTDYQWRSKPASRIELSANYYPSWWILEGCAVSVGGVYRARSGPTYFLEVSRPFEWPPAWVRTVWKWFGK